MISTFSWTRCSGRRSLQASNDVLVNLPEVCGCRAAQNFGVVAPDLDRLFVLVSFERQSV